MQDWSKPYSRQYGIFSVYVGLGTDPGTNKVDWLHLYALAAKAASAESPTYREILSLSEDERDKWFVAMEAELKALGLEGNLRKH
jgi:hypothetical protein